MDRGTSKRLVIRGSQPFHHMRLHADISQVLQTLRTEMDGLFKRRSLLRASFERFAAESTEEEAYRVYPIRYMWFFGTCDLP